MQSIPAVAGYDPYIGRAIGSLRCALSAGYPVMVRLHPGREYATRDEAETHALDREGHAVLLVGFDDLAGAFEIADPAALDPRTGFAARRQLPFDEFAIRIVDSTLDFALIISPLQVEVVPAPDGGHLTLTVGLYAPSMPVVDQRKIRLTNISVICGKTRIGAGSADVGSPAKVLVASEILEGEVTIDATIEGHRPLAYSASVRAAVPAEVLVTSLMA